MTKLGDSELTVDDIVGREMLIGLGSSEEIIGTPISADETEIVFASGRRSVGGVDKGELPRDYAISTSDVIDASYQ